MALLKALLLPLAWLYHLATAFRNYLFDIGYKKSFSFQTMVISVGNLNVGGSGKTPMTEYLIDLLSKRFQITTLSRGYGRKTRGYRLASEADSAVSIGDEPFQMYKKYGSIAGVAVGEERAYAIPMILQERPQTEIILLDDAFQHRTVTPQFSVLVTDYAKPFYKDFLLPYGRLRESRKGVKRADIIVVTKCPSTLGNDEREKIEECILRFTAKPVFFTSLSYRPAVAFKSGSVLGKKVILVTGIASATALKSFVKSQHELVHHFEYVDHHRYSPGEIAHIQNRAQQASAHIVTTEKDYARLVSMASGLGLDENSWFYIPIRQEFLENGLNFDELILSKIENVKANANVD